VGRVGKLDRGVSAKKYDEIAQEIFDWTINNRGLPVRIDGLAAASPISVKNQVLAGFKG